MRTKIKIDLSHIGARINHNQNRSYYADRISVVLRMKFLLFSDSKNVWEYDVEKDCFIKLDLQEKIQDLFDIRPVSQTFVDEVKHYLPLLENHQVGDYGKAVYSEQEEATLTKQKKAMNEIFKKNEAFVKDRISYNVDFNKKLMKKYEIIEAHKLFR